MHWIEQIIERYNLKSRYQLEMRGGVPQQTSYSWISRNTPIGDITLGVLFNIATAVVDMNPTLDIIDVMVDIMETYMPK